MTADGPGSTVTGKAFCDSGRDQPVARIGYRGHSGVGDHQDVTALAQRIEEQRNAGGLVPVEEGDDVPGRRHAQVGAQPAQPAGVLGGDDRGSFQGRRQPRRGVAGVAQWRRREDKAACCLRVAHGQTLRSWA